MAGIGFELKKLFNGRTAGGYLKAYSYSAVITAGPFALRKCSRLTSKHWRWRENRLMALPEFCKKQHP